MTFDDYMDFETYIATLMTKPREPYVAKPLYNRDGDLLQHFCTDAPCCAEQIDPYLTIYRDQETNEIMGAEIAGVRKALNRANCGVVKEP